MYFKRRKEHETRYSLALLLPSLAPRAGDRFFEGEIASGHGAGELGRDRHDASAVEAGPPLDLADLSRRRPNLDRGFHTPSGGLRDVNPRLHIRPCGAGCGPPLIDDLPAERVPRQRPPD